MLSPPVRGAVSGGIPLGVRASARSLAATRSAQLAVLLAAFLLIWHSLGDHALFAPDEGRYGTVSAAMAEHGNWLQPQLRDQVHVTKPPLTYWLQGVSIAVLGRTELAVRLPSALAASLLVLSLFWFVRRTCGALMAMLAVGVYAVMPLPMVMGRLGTTDSLLNTWWWLSLCFGYLAVKESGRARPWWVVGFWCAVSLIGLTKGPVIVAPLAIVGVWLLLGRSTRQGWKLHPLIGLPLAVAPLAAVAYLFWRANPERAESIWRAEFVDRVAGTGKHHDPIWEFIPILLVGMFPATTMLTLPGTNLTWRRAIESFRALDVRALMLVATVLPFVGFSLLWGKQPSYILPLAAPMAVLAAFTLHRWLAPTNQSLGPAPERLPEVRVLSALAMGVTAVGAPVAVLAAGALGLLPEWMPQSTLLVWSLVGIPAAAGWLACASMWHLPNGRAAGLGCAMFGMVIMYVCIQEVEDQAMKRMSSGPLAAHVSRADGPVLAYVLNDLTVDFYSGRSTEFTDKVWLVPKWMESNPTGIIMLPVDVKNRLAAHDARAFASLRPTAEFTVWPFKRVVVMEPRAPSAGAASLR
jgi:4-amino-4-deoxy-L-arabinose transferase-like glycosyltransferase